MKNDFKFINNTGCEYFPCHPTDDEERFNCKFCYCPLYTLGPECGGDFVYLADGTKDCSGCLKAHDPDFIDVIISKWTMIKEKAER